MAFEKTLKTIDGEIKNVAERLVDFQKKLASKEQDLVSAKEQLAKELANAALADSADNEERIKRSRKAVSLVTEAIDELRLQIDVLKNKQVDLVKDKSRALVAELPAKMEAQAKAFNKLIKEAIAKMLELAALHPGIEKGWREFTELFTTYDKACRDLGQMNTFELKEKMDFQPVNLEHFYAGLLAYQRNKEDNEAAAKANVDFAKRLQETRERQNKGYEFIPFARGGTSIFRQPDSE